MADVEKAHEFVFFSEAKEGLGFFVVGDAARGPVAAEAVSPHGEVNVLHGAGYRRYFLDLGEAACLVAL